MLTGKTLPTEALNPPHGISGSDLRMWLAESAPQTADGAYCGWLDAVTRSPSFAYPEITGYLLTFASYCGWENADRPVAASKWLTSVLDRGQLRCRPDKSHESVYLFDLGMIAQGLLRYGNHIADQTVVDTGLKVVAAICCELSSERDALHPVRGGHDMPQTWSTAGTAHLLKLLLPLSTAAELGEETALLAGRRLVESAGAPFDPTATPPIVTCPGAEVVSLHAACYAAEGLWAYAAAQRHPESDRQARDITRWVWTRQLPDGGFPAFVSTDGRAVGGSQSDVLAQAVRLAYLTGADAPGLDAAIAALTASAAADNGGAAMIYSPGSGNPHLNVWSTMFAAQALDLHESAAHQFHWRDLV